VASGGDDLLTSNLGSMLRARPPLDLTNRRLRTLAAALGPANVRVSGSWANKAYFQKAGDPATVSAPPGFEGVLTRAQWRGVVDFVRAVDGRLLVSFAVGAGVRDAKGTWTPDQARDLIDYTKSVGGRINAAEFFNEPNTAELGGAPKGYDAAAFAKDHAVFEVLMGGAIRVVGPAIADVTPLLGLSGINGIRSEDLLGTSPGLKLDVFSYHHYPALSQRCKFMGAQYQVTRDDAISLAWFAQSDKVIDEFNKLRDTYAPGKPIWVTEIADAACGGNPWSLTFRDNFRFADELGRYARAGIDSIFHNTLIGSEYALVAEDTVDPRPKYWVALLWRRLMGEQSLEVRSPGDGVELYAQCRRGLGSGVSMLAINTTGQPRSIRSNARADIYSLTADNLDDRSSRLNGRLIEMGANDRLPELRGQPVAAGNIMLKAYSVTFLDMPRVRNRACSPA
ncbi:MAG TPA: glycosyl hydrolase, partial [Sphingobium sp.]|uniref:glycosyl hydrolase n=1 Tax=Sphingobium sp. TaxID=1912891 RepID=UPI002ED5D3B3